MKERIQKVKTFQKIFAPTRPYLHHHCVMTEPEVVTKGWPAKVIIWHLIGKQLWLYFGYNAAI